MEASASMVWEGADDMRLWLVPIGDLTPHPSNPRRGDVEEIKGSLARFGQVRAILADHGTIIAGNHTYKAAVELGWTHVAAVLHEFEDAAEARAYLLADNRLGDLGEYETVELREHLEALETSGHWEGTGWQDQDLAYLRKLEEAASRPVTDPVPRPSPSAPSTTREVVLLFGEEQQPRFATAVKKLREGWQLEGVTEIVVRAVRAEALRVQKEAP